MTNKDLNSYSSSIGKLEAHLSFKVKYCHKIFFFGRLQAFSDDVRRYFEKLKVGKGLLFTKSALTRTMCTLTWT